MQKTGKIWNILGLILGFAVVVMGIVLIFTPAHSFSASSADYASFGADFYSYQYDATRIAAGNAAVTANNIRELGGKLALYAGLAFVITGLLIVLHYAKCLATAPRAAAPVFQPEAVAPTAPVMPAAPEAPVARGRFESRAAAPQNPGIPESDILRAPRE